MDHLTTLFLHTMSSDRSLYTALFPLTPSRRCEQNVRRVIGILRPGRIRTPGVEMFRPQVADKQGE